MSTARQPAQAVPAQAVPPTTPAVAPRAPTAGNDTPISPSGKADRLPPPVVPDVVRDGVRYAQAEDGRDVGMNQVGGVLVAYAADSGKRLWALAVYGNPVDPGHEADVQWLFFRSMAFEPDGRLRVVNEAGKAFLVDVGKRTVLPVP